MERMCGLWVPNVKPMQQADRNLSIALLRDAQLHFLPYAVNTQHTTDDSDASRDMMDELFSGDSAEEADNRQVSVIFFFLILPHHCLPLPGLLLR